MRTSFKRAQLLPVLTPEMIVERGSAAALQGVWSRPKPAQTSRPVTRRLGTIRLPGLRAIESRTERAVFGLLALSGAVAVGYALVLTIKLATNWPMFNAWVAQLLG